VVELMMAIALFAVGVTGIAAMQTVTVASNQHAKSLALANHIAQTWIEQLAADGSLWEAADINATGTRFLSISEGPNAGLWVRPVSTADFGATFGPLGEFTPTVSESFFCVHVRLTKLAQETTPVQGNGVIRTEVRVFWPRDGRVSGLPTHYCDAAVLPTDVPVSATANFHFVHKVSAVRQAT
jgi:hypothetical protein